MTPSDATIRAAFSQTADTIVSDMYQLYLESEDKSDDFEMSREAVADYLYMHGGSSGREVYDWANNLTEEDFHKELDRVGVPKAWHE